MRVERLRLMDFRNYPELDLPLPSGLVIFAGRNAQGKSNLLEAVSLIATTRSFRTSSEREVVRWGATGHFARLEGDVVRRADTLQVEVILADSGQNAPQPTTPHPRTEGAGHVLPPAPSLPPAPEVPFRKRVRINGTPRRAMDLLGQVTVVVFAPTDLDLVIGSPSQRRHFLDLTLCQTNPPYCRALSQYQKVITQRAALLRAIREGKDDPRALAYWDEQLARLAAPILRARAEFLERAEIAARRVYAALTREERADGHVGELTGDRELERLALSDALLDVDGAAFRLVYRPAYDGSLDVDDATVAADIRARLGELRRREIAQGANVLGPHRDDFAFLADGVDLATYGSRGQQRTAALALKLAELEYIETETGDQPILLLDDVLSELDAQRRADLLAAVAGLDQVLLTTTDTTTLPPDALATGALYRVRFGHVERVEQ
ncbi:MAG: DNA replication and repair protein RecF [Ktedonobacterales bacterium]